MYHLTILDHRTLSAVKRSHNLPPSSVKFSCNQCCGHEVSVLDVGDVRKPYKTSKNEHEICGF